MCYCLIFLQSVLEKGGANDLIPATFMQLRTLDQLTFVNCTK